MKFKSPDIEKEFESVTIFLQDMAMHMDLFCREKFSQELIITRVKEHICGDSGVHEANRAFDVRNEFEGGRLYTDEQVKEIIDYMQSSYPRNDGKPTIIHHSFAGGPYHLHVQIALETTTYAPMGTQH